MELVTLRNQIEETNVLLTRLEHDMASYPQRDSLILQIESLTRMRSKLEAEFSAAADQLGMDICTYRIVGARERRPSVSGTYSSSGCVSERNYAYIRRASEQAERTRESRRGGS